MPAVPLVPGNPAPLFTARSSNNPQFRLESAAGRHLVLLFIGSAGSEGGRRALAALEPYRPLLNDIDLALFLVTTDPEDERQGRLFQQLPGIRIFWDFDRRVSTLYRAESTGEGMAFLLNPRLQVIAGLPLGEPAKTLDTLFDHARRQPGLAHQPAPRGFAPVLYVPHVFEASLCRALIDCYERGPHYASGMMHDEGGRTVVVQNRLQKQRRDHELNDLDLLRDLRQRIEWRLVPEILQIKAMILGAVGEEKLALARADELSAFLTKQVDPQTVTRVTALKGWIAARNGDDRAALIALASATQPTMRMALALAAMRAGDSGRARTLMEELSKRLQNDLEGALTRPRAIAWLRQNAAPTAK